MPVHSEYMCVHNVSVTVYTGNVYDFVKFLSTEFLYHVPMM